MRNAQRPERTREHYIDALGRNHVERFVLLQGHTADEPRPDYGYDLVVTTFDYRDALDFKRGEVENGVIYLQLKSTDALKKSRQDTTKISLSLKRRHLVYWINEPMPVVLIVYSVPDDQAYWLHMQPYLKSSGFIMPPDIQEEVAIYLSTGNVLDEDAIKAFRQYKADALKRIEGLNLYG